MQQNESAPAKKEGGSQTTIKALGVEFSGPSWLALVVAVAVIVGGIVYLSDDDEVEAPTATAAEVADEVPATESAAAGEPATAEPTPDQDPPAEEASTEHPAAASSESAP